MVTLLNDDDTASSSEEPPLQLMAAETAPHVTDPPRSVIREYSPFL